MRTHIVKTGDTLTSIAKYFYNDYSKYTLIARANGIDNPNDLKVGQVLKIPDISGAGADLEIDSSTFQLPIGGYYREEHRKRMILLHFTAGTTAAGAFTTFKNNRGRVATPYILDRDGKIYEIFPPRYWAIHLFRHYSGEYPIYYQLEQRTIPIEIVNVGPLKPDSGDRRQLNWWAPPHPVTGRETFSTKWCMMDESDKYVKKTDRGIQYFAAFTAAQYASLNKLIDYLCLHFDIPRQAPRNKLATDLEGMINFNGIASHQNFRSDKWDIGPAFDWGKIGL